VFFKTIEIVFGGDHASIKIILWDTGWNAVAVKSHVEKVGHIECTKDTPYEILELLP
jgi:hypothetical protein